MIPFQCTGDAAPKPPVGVPVGTPSDEEIVTFVDEVGQQGERVQLSPQQRVPHLPAGKVIVLRDGMLAVDAMPEREKLQILDFLIPGDVVSASIVLPTPGVSLRAITRSSLVCLDPPGAALEGTPNQYWTFLVAQCLNQLARINLHQLMIGRLGTDARVASFLLGFALRSARDRAGDIAVALPMSRTDIANYLVINCDTLSRTMMRFSDSGLIARRNRHSVLIKDLEGLRRRSPLSPLLSKVLGAGSERDRAARPAQPAAVRALVQPVCASLGSVSVVAPHPGVAPAYLARVR